MAVKRFSFVSFLVRFVMALLLVFCSYNPSGHSWYHWVTQADNWRAPQLIFAGVVLLIGWVVYLRATLRSLGEIGTVLAVAFFAALTWVMVDYGLLSLDNPTIFTWVLLTMLAAIMATGMSWSHIRRRMSGQLDVDDVEEG
jgi:hypothetical protein